MTFSVSGGTVTGASVTAHPTTEPFSGLPKHHYQILLVDPPWHWHAWSSKGEGRSASRHYALMGETDIAALPVSSLCAPDCALFLWATSPMLPLAFRTIEAWGFRYKTVAFVWAKQTRKSEKWHVGLGYWTRANAEYCLLATRGKPKRIAKNVCQLVISRVREHSRKPEEVAERIVHLMGDLPRIELFARNRKPDWHAWGEQLEHNK